jgi:hypothetical protein
VDGVHISMDQPSVLGPPSTDTGVDRGHGGALTSLASGRSGAPKLTGGGARRRGERGALISGLTEARAALWKLGDGDAERGGGGAR